MVDGIVHFNSLIDFQMEILKNGVRALVHFRANCATAQLFNYSSHFAQLHTFIYFILHTFFTHFCTLESVLKKCMKACIIVRKCQEFASVQINVKCAKMVEVLKSVCKSVEWASVQNCVFVQDCLRKFVKNVCKSV